MNEAQSNNRSVESMINVSMLERLYQQASLGRQLKSAEPTDFLTVEEFLVYHVVGAKNIPENQVCRAACIIGDMLCSLIEDYDLGFVKFSQMFDAVNDLPCWVWVAMVGHLPFFTEVRQPVIPTPKVTIPSGGWNESEFEGVDPVLFRRAAYDFCQKHRLFT